MGRHAGFLTAAAALGKEFKDSGPHFIYVPEVAFDLDKFVKDVAEKYKEIGRCVIAVSEGVEDANGTPILALLSKGELEADSHGNVQLSGTGALADALVGKLKEYFTEQGIESNLRARGDTFGYLQRSWPDQSPVDREEALNVGRTAAKEALSGNVDGSIAIQRVSTEPYEAKFVRVPLKAVAGKTRHLPSEHINAEGNNVTDEFIKWGKPLIGDLIEIGEVDMSKKVAKK